METILIAGGTGLIGQRITQLVDTNQYKIKILTRSSKTSRGNVSYHKWDINMGVIDPTALEADYLINLTGAGIADGRWSESRKKLLIDSRVKSTLLIHNSMQKAGKKFKASVSASAVGYYGDRGEEILDETSNPGDEFMATCCMLWEDASEQLSAVSQNNKILRVGVVMSTKDGALPKILMTKALRIFNYFGNGKQYYSWVHIDDISRMFLQLLTKGKHKIYNGVAPRPLTNKKFTHEVKDAIGAGLVLPAPAFALRLLLGEMANVVLNSNRVLPKNLMEENFQFEHQELTEAICDLLERKV